MPTTLQNFRAAMIVGAAPIVTTFWHAPMVRKCLVVQTKSFGLESPRTPGVASWVEFPKASEVADMPNCSPFVYDFRSSAPTGT